MLLSQTSKIVIKQEQKFTTKMIFENENCGS